MIIDELMLARVSRDRRFDKRTLEIARKLFIEKQEPLSVAKEFALLDKRIYAIRDAVRKQVASYGLPEGWTEVTLRGPADLVKTVEVIFRKRMKRLSAEGSSAESAAET